MKQALYLMLGYPGSGKSTFAKQLAPVIGAVRLNSDELRRTIFTDTKDIRNPKNNPFIFGALDYAAQKILQAGYSIIYDANNNHFSERRGAETIASKQNVPTIVLWVQTPLEIAKQRESSRSSNGETLAIPKDRYQELIDALEEPQAIETCIIIDGQKSFNEQLQEFNREVAELSIK